MNEADAVWHKAKTASDYASFAPYVRKIFAANVRFAGYYRPGEKPYDVQMGLYEHGLTMERADAFFRGFDIIVPRETTDTLTQEDCDRGLEYIKNIYGGTICSMKDLPFWTE